VPNPGEAIRALQKPVIAAVNGPCATGALEMALSCSFVIASEQARFADTHAKVGLFPRWGQCTLLTQAVGLRRARQLMLTGQFIDAPQALQWGIVNEIVAADRLLARCLKLGEAIAASNSKCIGLLREALAGAPEAVAGAEQRALAQFDGSSADGTPR
jgi:enoyl-CoA hydratase